MYCLLLSVTQLLTALVKLESQVIYVWVFFKSDYFETSHNYIVGGKMCISARFSGRKFK